MPISWQPIAGFLVGGIGGWVVTEFVGRPFRKFFDLKGEIIRQMTLIANVKPAYRPNPDKREELLNNVLSHDETARLRAAESALRELAARMREFALNERFAKSFVVRLGYDPDQASAALLGIEGTINRKGQEFANHKATLEKALRLDPHTL